MHTVLVLFYGGILKESKPVIGSEVAIKTGCTNAMDSAVSQPASSPRELEDGSDNVPIEDMVLIESRSGMVRTVYYQIEATEECEHDVSWCLVQLLPCSSTCMPITGLISDNTEDFI